MTHKVERSALLPYSAAEMYALVADIPRYGEFLNWCSSAAVLSEEGDTVIASITIAFKGLKKTFVTRNRMRPFESIAIKHIQGPFSHLEGVWRFTPLDKHASKIELDLHFDFDSRIVASMVGPVFSHISNSQVDAFRRRAQVIYGKR